LEQFDKQFSCAEAVFLGGMKYLGVESELVPRLATAFGGGFSRTKSMCGALAGAAMVVSMKYGRNTPSDDRQVVLQKVKDLVSSFKSKFGSDNCFELTGIDFDKPEDQARYKDEVHVKVCTGIVEWSVRKAIDLCEDKKC
jgi:C_GCAxxG_C_C family probable redox protein